MNNHYVWLNHANRNLCVLVVYYSSIMCNRNMACNLKRPKVWDKLQTVQKKQLMQTGHGSQCSFICCYSIVNCTSFSKNSDHPTQTEGRGLWHVSQRWEGFRGSSTQFKNETISSTALNDIHTAIRAEPNPKDHRNQTRKPLCFQPHEFNKPSVSL